MLHNVYIAFILTPKQFPILISRLLTTSCSPAIKIAYCNITTRTKPGCSSVLRGAVQTISYMLQLCTFTRGALSKTCGLLLFVFMLPVFAPLAQHLLHRSHNAQRASLCRGVRNSGNCPLQPLCAFRACFF